MKRISVLSLFVVLLGSCGPSGQKEQKDQSRSKSENNSVETPKKKELSPEADSVFQEINERIRNDINNPDLYLERSRLYELVDDEKAAVADINRALSIDSTYLNTMIAQAEFLIKRGELKTSLSILEYAKKLHPEASVVYTKMSELYLVARNFQKSLENADLAVKHDKFNAKAYYLKGYNFVEMGDTSRAISSYQTAVEQNPEDFESYMQLGLIHAAQDDPLALDYLKNALNVRPESQEAKYAIGMYQQEHEMYNEAMKTYTQAIKKHPNFKEAHYNLGYVLMYYLQLYRDATHHFTDAIKIDPAYYQAYYNRGYCFELMGDINNAEKDYRKALEIQPDYDLAAKGLSRLTEK
ncbi:MAG: tetratricopeptide repeat protein [Vicingaceae bacterium]